MIKRIKTPDWADGHVVQDEDGELLDINEWFNKYVEPINRALEAAVEVYCWDEGNNWHAVEHDLGKFAPNNHSKALLINIEPIKQETCADVLRDWVAGGFDQSSLLARAKAVLEQEE